MYAIVDIETTGGHAASNGITEIAVFVHDGERTVQHFTTLINPQRPVPSFITALTGISNAMVATAPSFEEVAPKLYELLDGNIFVAHNVNFDHSFIYHHLKQHGYELKVKKLCTVRLSRKTFPNLPSYSLGKICRSLNITIEDRHRANGDARATEILFNKILNEGGKPHIDTMLKRSSSEQWLPVNLDKAKIEALPPQPGVYYFHDSKGKVIYVGKAINLRRRVAGHFTHTDTGRRRQNFLRLVHNITCKVCANELHALVLESTEIKKLWPKYNYSQKKPVLKFALYSFEDNRGYVRLAIDRKKKNLPSLYNFNLLNEGLVMIKRMAEEFGLHHKLCFIDRNPFTDADMEFLEGPVLYNNRVRQCLERLDEELPAFALMDDGAQPGERICFLIEKGNFWGMGHVPNSLLPVCAEDLKAFLEPYADNDFIRNSIYSHAAAYPEKKIIFSA